MSLHITICHIKNRFDLIFKFSFFINPYFCTTAQKCFIEFKSLVLSSPNITIYTDKNKQNALVCIYRIFDTYMAWH